MRPFRYVKQKSFRQSLPHHWQNGSSIARHRYLGNSACSAIVSSSSYKFTVKQPSPSRSFAMVAQTLTPPSPTVTLADDSHWQYVMPTGSTTPHFVYSQPIEKPERDDREYRFIRLQNGLQALLIHDATADQAAAALNIAVGHLSDPDDMPGLAHFCEHLLFMGTEQFPKENEYSDYLNKNGGSSNAYTAASNTNYYFSVNTNAFAGALERFSGFFHSPLFSPSCTIRELQAVHSEHKKNLQSDSWRIFQLTKHLSKDGHPWRKFGSGNIETLTAAAKALKAEGALKDMTSQRSGTPFLSVGTSKLPSPQPSRSTSPAAAWEMSKISEDELDGGVVGRETRRRLVEWWSKEYCAGRMGLTIVAKESLDELTDLVVSFFSPIKNRGQVPLTLINDSPYGRDQKSTMVFIKTIMDFYALELSFPVPYQTPLWRTKPGNLISHFVGHEGPGSLHSYLKGKGWIVDLSSGVQNQGRGFAMFSISVTLTKEGFENYRSIILSCFNYLSLLRSTGISKSYQDELKAIRALQFRFTEKSKPSGYASALSERIPGIIPPGQILSGKQLLWDWDENQVREMLNMLTIDNGRVVLMAKDFSTITQGEELQWSKEPVYGTEYILRKLDQDFVNTLEAPDVINELVMPPDNNFIPSRLNVEKRDVVQPMKRPVLLKETPLTTVWHKKDDQFWVPRACVRIQLITPKAVATARDITLNRLYVDLVTDALTEHVYDAAIAGLNSNIRQDSLGITIRLEGYNDKLDVLARLVLDKIRNLKVLPERLEVIKEELDLECKNWFFSQSYQICDYLTQYVLRNGVRTVEEIQAEIPSVGVAELQSYISDFLSKLNITVLVTGNATKSEALELANLTENLLKTKPIPKAEIPHDLSRILPTGCEYVLESVVPNPKQTNAAVAYYCHIGDATNPRLRVLTYFLARIISEPAFDVLRTKEQLGYVVFSSTWASTESIGLRVLAQSEKDPKYVETRIDAFLAGFRDTLETMSEEQFEEHRRGLIHLWNEKDKNLLEESRSYWTHIQSGYFDFFRAIRDSVLLETVNRGEILALYDTYLNPSSTSRSKFSVHLRPQSALPRHFSSAAAGAYLALLRSCGVKVDEKEYQDFTANEPTISEFQSHWSGVLLGPSGKSEPAVTKMLLDAIEELSNKFPATGEHTPELKAGTEKIDDAKAFKQSLKLSQPARPLESFHDLPMPKF